MIDLGSGAGLDVFLAAKKVGSDGRAIGIDMNKVSTASSGTWLKLIVRFSQGHDQASQQKQGERQS